MTQSDDSFFELRLYRVQPGRLHDMERRVQEDLRRLFPKHGIHPLGVWSVIVGAEAPQLVYLLHWAGFEQRAKALAAFVADPAWAEARDRSNAGSQLVERYEILFLRAMREWKAPEGANEAAVFELILQETAMGHAAEVRLMIDDIAIPAWADAGAEVCGVFDVINGKLMPSAVFLLAWPDSLTRIRASEPLQARLHAVCTPSGTSLLQRGDQYLMRKLFVDWSSAPL